MTQRQRPAPFQRLPAGNPETAPSSLFNSPNNCGEARAFAGDFLARATNSPLASLYLRRHVAASALALVVFMWQFCSLLPLPHQHGSLQADLGPLLRTV